MVNPLNPLDPMNPLQAPTGDDKLWAGLSYVGLAVCLVPTVVILLIKKDESAFVKFHALQALGLGIASIAISIILSIPSHLPWIGLLFGLLGLVISLCLMGYWIYLMIMAFSGKDVQIPVLSDFIRSNLMN